MKATMKGAPDIKKLILDIAQKFPDKVKAAMYQEAQIEMTEAKRRTPVDTGALRASGFVSEPERHGTNISVKMSFGGGPSADYAIPVHENTEAHHSVGQAKFLESVINESAPHMAERIGSRISMNEQKAEKK